MKTARTGAVAAICVGLLAVALPAFGATAPPPAPDTEQPAAQPAPPPTPLGAALATTQKAVAACLQGDEEAAFAAYLALVHPERKPTEQAVADIRKYTWKRFRQQCRHFVKGGDVATLEVVRVQPDPIPADAETFKVFFAPVSQPRRMPAPVIYRRLDADWLIDTNSM
jgi:hypothetical protein